LEYICYNVKQINLKKLDKKWHQSRDFCQYFKVNITIETYMEFAQKLHRVCPASPTSELITIDSHLGGKFCFWSY
jgi:hypothetical protein